MFMLEFSKVQVWKKSSTKPKDKQFRSICDKWWITSLIKSTVTKTFSKTNFFFLFFNYAQNVNKDGPPSGKRRNSVEAL